jgi:hypothetical protein
LKHFPAGRISLNTGNRRRPAELVLEGEFRGKRVRLHVWMRPPRQAAVEEVIDLLQPGGAQVREKA